MPCRLIERRKLMGGHAKVGREFSGKVKQLITGSTGLDDAEWGVTLFARDTFQIKKIVYEMRFDPVSAEYADFGEFFVGIQLPLDELFRRLQLVTRARAHNRSIELRLRAGFERMGDRAVDCARLESVCAARHQGFESPPIQTPMNLSKFFGELKRRSCTKWRLDISSRAGRWLRAFRRFFLVFDIPNWVVRLSVLLIIVGFPVALVLSWFFDLTRYGIVRTPDAERYGKVDIAPPIASKEKSIAVLPFTDLSPSGERDYFGDGIAEEILCALAKIDGLRVAARRSSFWFKEKEAELREIARKLNVAHVLEGTVRRDGNRVRITAELIDASEGFTIWSETFDREFERIFALQDEITHAIIDALKLKLDIPTARPATRNTEAYDLYLRARALGAHSDERSLERQIALLHEALAADPDYTTAWAETCLRLRVDRRRLSRSVGSLAHYAARRVNGGKN